MASARTHVRNEPHFTFLSYVCSNSGHGSGHAYCWGAVSRSPGRRNGDAGHIRVPPRWGGGLPDGIAWSSPRSIRPDRRPPAAAPARQSHELRPRSGKAAQPHDRPAKVFAELGSGTDPGRAADAWPKGRPPSAAARAPGQGQHLTHCMVGNFIPISKRRKCLSIDRTLEGET